MSDKAEKFEVAVIGKQIRVQRTLKTAYGWVDLDLTYEHSIPRDKLTLEDIHDSSLEIAIADLQSRRTQRQASPGSQQPAASA